MAFSTTWTIFLFIGPPDLVLCAELLHLFCKVMVYFGVPLAGGKTCLPSTSLEFLGILIILVGIPFTSREAGKALFSKSCLYLLQEGFVEGDAVLAGPFGVCV